MTESNFVRHEPCPKCGSKDACAVFDDGHRHCFSMGCDYHTRSSDDTSAPAEPTQTRRSNVQLVQGSPITVSKRSITPETFEKWKYQEGELANGEKVHLANHIVNGQIIGQKIRTAKKDFKVFGEMDALYGRWLWGKGGKRVIVTEGEIDALSVSQAQGNKWPVVSVPNGAAGAEKAFKKSIDWLTSYDEVVIAFDNDEPGTLAAKACAAILPPGKAKIATLPLKDANEMLKAGREDELIRCLWNATEYRPDGIVALKDVVEDALRPVEIGRPWPFPSLTSATYGRRLREVYTLGAGTGVGKTDVLTECIAFDLNTLSLNVGVLFLEQDKRETVQRLAGKLAGKRFHVPDGTWSEGELRGAIRELESKGALYLYDNFGATDWATIRDRIEYMVQALGCEHIYLDHLTALAAAEDDERKALETIMSELAGQAKRLNCCIHLVSHLSTPDGTPHEEGGRVMIRHFKGSRAIGFWSYFMFGLERDQQDDDESMRNVTTFRVLKDRYTGQATGKTFYLKYDHETGRLSEWTPDNFAASDNEPQDF